MCTRGHLTWVSAGGGVPADGERLAGEHEWDSALDGGRAEDGIRYFRTLSARGYAGGATGAEDLNVD
jgi:hypothetical protein